MVTEASGQPEPAAVVTDPAVAAGATTAANDAAAKATADAAAAKATADTAAAKVTADAAAAATAKAEADAKGKVPDKYADFTMPEGVTLDPEVLGEFSTVAKELGLSQEQAQKLADIAGKSSLKTRNVLTDQLAKARDEWTKSCTTDAELGGEKFKENLAAANSVFAAFGTPALKSLLEDSGIGNHPEMVRWAYKVSKAVSPDTIVNGRASAGPTDPASVLYDAPKKAA